LGGKAHASHQRSIKGRGGFSRPIFGGDQSRALAMFEADGNLDLNQARVHLKGFTEIWLAGIGGDDQLDSPLAQGDFGQRSTHARLDGLALSPVAAETRYSRSR
jgi:hypothetical protein